ncbi:hypothetical protein CWATWH0402_5825 [Crocosphaera watsonii WH 0402]|uniref:Uncharacterized protein n=1 Tax=Crocosphaera watsonii WH 0402 TaxID=1284629 RepID=T2JKU2_CROWT|nr:hypothetical protein CWATWH0402_5825 [Crocosphaera watsonii WH 0402]
MRRLVVYQATRITGIFCLSNQQKNQFIYGKEVFEVKL